MRQKWLVRAVAGNNKAGAAGWTDREAGMLDWAAPQQGLLLVNSIEVGMKG